MLKSLTAKAAEFPYGRAVALGAAAVAVSLSLAACGGGGNAQPAGGQNDARYNVAGLEAPKSETYNGSEQTFPEGYVPAYKRDTEDGTVNQYSVEQQFDVNGTKYTVHAPSKVHASSTSPGQDSFFVDLEVTPASDGKSSSGTSIFVYSASGLYSYDMVERAAEEKAMQEMQKRESEAGNNPEATSKSYDEYEKAIREAVPDGSDGKPYTRTFEIPYDGDGSYALSVKDFVNDTIAIVNFDIKL